MAKPAIIYVPGMKPKPPVDVHRSALWRCLCEAVRRASPDMAREIDGAEHSFRLAAWADLFYQEQRDFALDAAGVERLFAHTVAPQADIDEARHWNKRLARLIYLLCDAVPALTDLVANPNIKATLLDVNRYFDNADFVGTQIRRRVASHLQDAWDEGRDVLLIAHSLGSVIAFDVLWELSRQQQSDLRVDLLLTIGSPLGMRFVKHRLLGARERGAMRYPDNIRCWKNLSAVGELTALDRIFADDFAAMPAAGLVESIEDQTDLVTFFRNDDGLNVHKCYGYMINEKLGAVVADWWQSRDECAG